MAKGLDSKNARWERMSPWAPVAIWAAVIWSLGSDPFSLPQTSLIIGPILHWLVPSMGNEKVDVIIFCLRRSAHVGEYGLFALLTLRAWLLTSRLRVGATGALSLLLALLLASADETRQAVSTSRTGSPRDVLLDLSGATLALLAVPAILRRLGLFERFSHRERD